MQEKTTSYNALSPVVQGQVPLEKDANARLSVSIVLFETPTEDIHNAIEDLKGIDVSMVVTVVDNSPTSGLRDVVQRMGATYIHTGDNRGFGAGHNIVMRDELLSAPYHLVLNADVRIPKGTVEALIEYMDQVPAVGMVMPKVLNADGSEQFQARRLPTPLDLVSRRVFKHTAPNWEERLNTSLPISVPFLCGCFMLLRKDVLARSGFFDERFFLYMEDADLCRRIGDIADTVYHPGVNIYHSRARASYKNLPMLWAHIRSAVQYFNKWGWIWDQSRHQRNLQAGQPAAFAYDLYPPEGSSMA